MQRRLLRQTKDDANALTASKTEVPSIDEIRKPSPVLMKSKSHYKTSD